MDNQSGRCQRRSRWLLPPREHNNGSGIPRQLGAEARHPERRSGIGARLRRIFHGSLLSETIYGIYGATPGQTVNETLSFRDDLSIIKGTHAFKAGYEVLRFRLNSANFANPVQYSFANVTAGFSRTERRFPTPANTFAGFLTGYVSQAIFRSELTSWLPRSSIHSFYFQDDWKILPDVDYQLGCPVLQREPVQHQVRADVQLRPDRPGRRHRADGRHRPPDGRLEPARQQQLQSAPRSGLASKGEVGVPRRLRLLHGRREDSRGRAVSTTSTSQLRTSRPCPATPRRFIASAKAYCAVSLSMPPERLGALRRHQLRLRAARHGGIRLCAIRTS